MQTSGLLANCNTLKSLTTMRFKICCAPNYLTSFERSSDGISTYSSATNWEVGRMIGSTDVVHELTKLKLRKVHKRTVINKSRSKAKGDW